MNKQTIFWSFRKARAYVRRLRLKSLRQWSAYSSTKRPPFIPSSPASTYKNKWINWSNWMGYDSSTKKYSVNENFFKTWSHDMSYILGFWFADGYIYLPERLCNSGNKPTKRYIFGITQCERYILKNISVKMQSSYPIHTELYHKKKRKSYRFFIESKTLVEDLIKLGGSPRKSLTMIFPQIPTKYLADFIRGLWDGDGSVFVCEDGKAHATFTSGSRSFIDSLLLVLKSSIPEFTAIVSQDKRRKSAYTIMCGPNAARRLRNFMYTSGGLHLKRKKKIFDSLGGINPSSSQRKAGFMNYDEAHAFALKLGLSKQSEWFAYCKNGQRPANIPSNPSQIYKNSGWTNWKTWLTGEII